MDFKNIVNLALGLILIAALVPEGLEAIFSTDTTNWSLGAAALWTVIGVVVVIGLVINLLPASAGGKGE